MCIGIARVEIDRAQSCIESLPLALLRIIGPTIGDEAGIHPRTPELRLREHRIRFRGLAKELSRKMMSRPRHLVKIESALPNEIPGGYIAGVRCHRAPPAE